MRAFNRRADLEDEGIPIGEEPLFLSAVGTATIAGANDAYASNTALNVSRDYSRNGLNQYTSTTSNGTPSATFAYDANGNLTSDGSTNFVYDAENRLVSATGAKTLSLAYDPLGRLWQTSNAAVGTTRFVYDGDRLVQEFDGPGSLLRVYVHGPGADEPVVWYELTGGPVRRFLHADHQGSITAVTDDYGNVLGGNAYDPWGIPNATNLGRFQYTGQTWIAELGMYYYKARFYSPTLGRFMQTDPIGYDDQINLYAYVGNDPINMTDPTGEAGACEYSPSGCDYGADFEPVINVFRGAASYPRDLVVGARFIADRSGLRGEAAQNRALVVAQLTRRAAGVVMNHPMQAIRRLGPFALNNKAFIAGRAGTGALVSKGGTKPMGLFLGAGALVGGALRVMNGVVAQMEAGKFNTNSLSNDTLGALALTGVMGGSANFDARTGNLTVTMTTQGAGSRLSQTKTHVLCNVNDKRGC